MSKLIPYPKIGEQIRQISSERDLALRIAAGYKLALQKISERHSKRIGGSCLGCDFAWPCPTYEAAKHALDYADAITRKEKPS